MKSDVTGSPSEGVGPRYTQEGMSAEHDLVSDDEPETELEALQHLPPEERRRALRRLRNRESARRVRARRLAEMSQMETTVQGMQDENTTLKEHVAKLQGHIQQMTMKVYEVTAKYEAAVAENAQLRAELQRSQRGSIPGGEGGFTPPTASLLAAQPPLLPSALLAAAASQGPNSAPHLGQTAAQHQQQHQHPLSQMEKSSVQVGGDGGGANAAATAPGCLPSLALGSHAQLRNSNAMDVAQQRAALDEVVMLLHEHKHRRNQQDRSACSEIGSSGVGNAAAGAVQVAPHANSFSTGVNNNFNRSTGVQLHIRTSSVMNDGSAAVGSGSGGFAAAPPNAASPALDTSGAAAAGLMPAFGSGLAANTPSINNAGGPGPVPLSFLTASGSANSGATGLGAAGAGVAAGLGGHRASSPMDMITAASVAAASAGIVAAGGLGDGSGGRPSRSDGMVSMLQMTPQQVTQQHQLMAQVQQQQQSQLQHQMEAARNTTGSSGLSHLGMSYSMDAAFMAPQQQQQQQAQQQAQQQQQQQTQGPSSAFDLSAGLSQMQMQMQMQQQRQAMPGASHSQPLLKMQLSHHQQFSHSGQQQNMVLDGSGHQQHTAGQSQPLLQLYQHHNTAPDFAKMSAPYRPTAAGGEACGYGGDVGASAALPTIPSSGTLTSNGQLSCLERGVLGGGSMYLGGTGGTGTGMAGSQQVTFHSASFAMERRTAGSGLPPPHPQLQPHSQFATLASGLCGGAGGMNIAFQHQEQQAIMQQHGLGAEGWHLNAVAAGVAALKPEDISEDMMMTLDELSPFVPQDL